MCRNSTSPPTRKAFYTSCVCIFLQKKKTMKRVWPNVFKAFRNQNQIFCVFWGGPIPTQGLVYHWITQRQECLCWPPWPNSQKKCSHRSGSVSPVSLIFFGMLQWLQLHKTHQNLPRLQKNPTTFFLHKKKAKRTKNGRFQATHSLPWPKSAPPFSVPTNER